MTEKEIEALAETLAEKIKERLRGHDLLLHSVPYIHGSPGLVVDAEAAKATPCTCYAKICFSKGIVGALSESQKTWACNPRIERSSPGMERRLSNWQKAVGVCKAEIERYPEGEKLEPWLECMGEELRSRGIEL